MIFSKTKRRQQHNLFHRTSLLVRFSSKHRLKANAYSYEEPLKRKSRAHHLVKNISRTYNSLCLAAAFIFRLFAQIDRFTREIFLFIEKLIQIIRVIHGWIQMLRSILSAIHLIVSRLMILISSIHRLFQLLTLLFQPFSNGQFANVVRSFSCFLFHYYSSNGACYTLHARTRHIVRAVRQRWRRKCADVDNGEEIFYDAISDEYEWF
ncbi:unnamed protein product [Adineta ricciae]|uniref:Uncharacterized protein n=1 Tax=Adineta ricciae TaxID=249248 RepID=A0A814H106_ADIRI|nr:unnamed protein product [Adineta ricciae]CAF1003425.1 unnamed protein product [Adineta ricciae]